MRRTVSAAEHVFNKRILVHTVESAGIAEHDQFFDLILRALSDAVVDIQDLLSVKR